MECFSATIGMQKSVKLALVGVAVVMFLLGQMLSLPALAQLGGRFQPPTQFPVGKHFSIVAVNGYGEGHARVVFFNSSLNQKVPKPSPVHGEASLSVAVIITRSAEQTVTFKVLSGSLSFNGTNYAISKGYGYVMGNDMVQIQLTVGVPITTSTGHRYVAMNLQLSGLAGLVNGVPVAGLTGSMSGYDYYSTTDKTARTGMMRAYSLSFLVTITPA